MVQRLLTYNEPRQCCLDKRLLLKENMDEKKQAVREKILSLAKERGVELSEEQLEGISGGTAT